MMPGHRGKRVIISLRYRPSRSKLTEVAHRTRKVCARDRGGVAKFPVVEKELETFIMACREKSRDFSGRPASGIEGI